MPTLDTIHTRIAAPAVAPHPYGLFSYVTPTSPTDHGLTGVSWDSWSCAVGMVSTTTDVCINGGAAPPAKTTSRCPTNIKVKPVTVYIGRQRGGQSYDVGEAQVRGALEDGEEFAIESWLWTKLAASITEVATALPAVALATVEETLANEYMGTGVIHMSRATATRLGTQNLLRINGRIETVVGTPVIVGAGYEPGAIYGTGQLVVYRSDIDVLDNWNLSVNDQFVIAERTYVVGWDCAANGALVS